MNSQAPTNQPFSGQGQHKSSSSGKRLSLLLGPVARNKILLIFCLLALAAVAVGMKFVFDISSEITKADHVRLSNPTGDQHAAIRSHAEFLSYFRNRMSLLLGVTIVCFGAMICLYVKHILRPLKLLTKITREMSSGNLSVSVQSHDRNEVGQLAEVINDLAANYQEVLLLTGTAVGKSSSAVERIERVLDHAGNSAEREELQNQLGVIKKDLEMLGAVVKGFEFYQTRFDGRKVVSTAGEPQGNN
jgi:methyl-accepting chemotaxis protein